MGEPTESLDDRKMATRKVEELLRPLIPREMNVVLVGSAMTSSAMQ